MGTTGPQTTSTTEPEKAGVETEVARPGARYLGELPSEARRRVVGRFMLIALVVNAVVLGVLLLQSSSDALPPQSSFDSGASPRIHWAQSGDSTVATIDRLADRQGLDVDTMRIRAVTDETERRVLALSTSDHRCLLADDSNGVTSACATRNEVETTGLWLAQFPADARGGAALTLAAPRNAQKLAGLPADVTETISDDGVYFLRVDGDELASIQELEWLAADGSRTPLGITVPDAPS